MTPTTVQNHILVTLTAVLLSSVAAMGAAQDIQTISHGDRVDITTALVPGKLTLIDFYADWCRPCRSLAPKLDRLANANSDVLSIRKVDIINWDSAVAAQYRLQSIPHL
ncbi:MAG: thioredoxin family protein, partial [Acidobacteria bacterium]|nr:thioredoxin family protein [Acidobacteriota bacterium]